jgi:tetratricopeptide (TPR) repeat protein
MRPIMPPSLASHFEAFEAAWEQPVPPRLEAYLPSESEPGRGEVLVGLVRIDLERRIKGGESVRVESYLGRFPELRESREGVLGLVMHEYDLRHRHDPPVNAEEYLRRFPEFSAELWMRWQTVPPSGEGEIAVAVPPPRPQELDLRSYELLDRVGRGGMGEVYRGKDPALGRDLAVKVLRPELRADTDAERRFEQEARVTGALQHPNIVPVHNLGRLPDGRLYFTMKLVGGRTLAEMLAEGKGSGRLPELLGVFEKVCQAIAFAHSHGVVHRDLKPSNVMVGAFGEVQVMDWGLAKVLPRDEGAAPGGGESGGGGDTVRRIGTTGSTADDRRTGTVGTPAYMPPEQARGAGDEVDERADVFGLGAILCEVLTGRPPYAGQSIEDILGKASRADTADALGRLAGCGADAELVALCKECLSANAEARPRDGRAVAERVAAYQAGVQERLKKAELERAAAEAREQEAVLRAKAERQKRRQAVGFAAFVILTLAVGGVAAGLWWQARARRQQAEEANQRLTGDDLQQAEDRLRHGDEEGTKQFLGRAKGRLDLGETDAMRGRWQSLTDALTFAAELNQLRERGLSFAPGGLTEVPLGPEYDETFRRHGLRVGKQDAVEIAATINASPIREPIVESLHHWFGNDPSRRAALAPVLEQVAPDDAWLASIRQALRDEAGPDPGWPDVGRMSAHTLRCFMLMGQNPSEMRRVGEKIKGSSHPPEMSTLEHTRELVYKAREAYPNDFWFNMFAAGASFVVRPRRPGNALADARAALALRPNSAAAYNLLGYVVMDAEKNPRQAIDYFQKAIKLDPAFLAPRISLGVALEKAGDTDGAIRSHQRAIELSPKLSTPYTNLASAHLARGGRDQAIEQLRKALEVDPRDARAHTSLGTLLSQKGDLAEALGHLKQAVEITPDDPVCQFNLGAGLRQKGDLEGAVRSYQRAVELDPGDSRAFNNLGSTLQDLRRLDESLRAHQRAVALEPTDALYHSNLGETLRARHELDAAVREFKRAIELNPRDAVFHNNLGSAYYAQGNVDGAIREYKKAVEVDDKFATAYVNLGVALSKKGRLKEALTALEKAVALDRRSAHAQRNLGSVQLDCKDLDAAITAFRTATEIDPNYAEAYNDLGSALRRKGDRAGARRAFERATEVNPKEFSAFVNLGDLLRELNDVDGALRACRRAVELAPSNVAAQNNLGAALYAKKDWDGAIRAFQAATKADPQSAVPYNNMADVFLAKGDTAGAVRAWRRAVELDPRNELTQRALAVNLRAKKDYDGALEVLRAAVVALPRSAALHEQLGFVLRTTGDPDGAVAAYRKAVELDPRSESAWWSLGVTLWKKGDVEGATAAHEKVVAINPKHGSAFFGLGKLYLQQGRFADAEKALTEAERHDSIIPGDKLPTQEPLQRARKLGALDLKLSKVLAGNETPADADETVNLAILCHQYKQMYVAATRFFADAFQAAPQLAEDGRNHYRANAARAAVLASERKGKDADKLPATESPRLRAQALAWLKADLAFWAKQAEGNSEAIRQTRDALNSWQATPDLSAIRDKGALDKLPEDERKQWRDLWDEVERLARRVKKASD